MRFLNVAIAASLSLFAVAAPATPSQVPPALEVSGEVEMSAAKVRRDTDPTREVILTVVTVSKPPSARRGDEPGGYAFVIEDEAGGRLLEHFKGAGKVIHAGPVLSVWIGTKDGWRFEQRDAKREGSAADSPLRRIPVLRIKRYLPAPNREVDHQALARTAFSGKVKR